MVDKNKGDGDEYYRHKNAQYSADVFACEATRAGNFTAEFRKRCTLL